MSDISNFKIENQVLVRYTGKEDTVVVPDGITAIGKCAFMGGIWSSSPVVNVVLPDSVTSIDNHAFDSCQRLKNINIPKGVTSIGVKAFYRCAKLEKIDIPDSVTTIGHEAFQHCEMLQSIVIPDSVTNLGTHMFSFCRALKSVVLPSSLKVIGQSMFYECRSLTKLSIPKGITEIQHYAFVGCKKLNFTVPESVVSIGDEVFRSSGIKSVRILEGMSIGENAFGDCKNLAEFEYTYTGKPAFPAFFGDIFPPKLSSKIAEWYPMMSDGQLKKYVLDKDIWKNLDPELKIQIFVARQAKTLLPTYIKSFKAEEWEKIAAVYLQKASEKLSVKECNAIGTLLLSCHQFLADQTVKSLYAVLKPQKNAAKVLPSLEEDISLKEKLGMDNAVDDTLPLPEQKVLAALLQKKWTAKELEKQFKVYYSDILIPSILYTDGTEAKPTVMQYLLMAHEKLEKSWEGGKLDVFPDYEQPGISPEAEEILSYIDRKSLQAALLKLADVNLGYSGHSKKMFLAYPICRYADEELMRELTKRAPSWRSSVSGNDAPPLRTFRDANKYSNTRSAMMFADKYHELEAYARLRGTDAETLRDQNLADVGLTADGKKTYDLGNQTVTAVLQNDLSFIIYLENGKTAKALPKKRSDAAKYEEANADFSEMKKSVKKILKNRQDLLFEEFLSGHSRSAETWIASYTENPLLRRMASILVWEQNGKTFTLTDGGAITADGSAYQIKKKYKIALAHPMEMDADDLTAWQKYFTSHALKQPFEQIWEPVVDPNTVKPDRYKNCKIPYYRFTGRAKHGIRVEDFDYHDYIEIYLKDCTATIERLDWEGHYIDPSHTFEIKEFRPGNSRMANHITAYFDRITIYGRILNDDVSIEAFLPNFTLAQIIDFANFASENQCPNVSILLINYRQEHFADYDYMAQFALEL